MMIILYITNVSLYKKMKKLILYISLFVFGIAILIPALVIAACTSALVADDQITIELHNIINGRPNHNR